MKALKKLSCLLLAVLLLMSVSVTAFAADEAGSITVNKAISGQTYTLYKVLSFVPAADHGTETKDVKGLYYVEDAWKEFFDAHDYIEYDEETGLVTSTDGLTDDNVKTFAAEALAYAEERGIANAGQQVAGDGGSVTFNNLDYGYYLVDSTTGALVSVDTAGPEAAMTEKNEIPQIDKLVYEDGTTSWGPMNHDDVGKEVKFQSTITVEAGAENYVMHDDMDPVLAWTGAENVSVTINGVPVDAENYEVVPLTENEEGHDHCTFEVRFDNEYVAGLDPDTKIVVSYSATITEAAQINIPYTNDVDLRYGDNSKTKQSHTDTYTYGFDLLKYALNTEDATDMDETLAGAVFAVYQENEDGSRNYLFYGGATGKTPVWTKVTADEDGKFDIPKECKFETPESGILTFNGLDADAYKLEEVEAPAGYNKIDEAIDVVIDPKTDGKVDVPTTHIDVSNTSGLELPETGGIGTTIFYAVGGVLVVAALVLLVTKKRMSKEG